MSKKKKSRKPHPPTSSGKKVDHSRGKVVTASIVAPWLLTGVGASIPPAISTIISAEINARAAQGSQKTGGSVATPVEDGTGHQGTNGHAAGSDGYLLGAAWRSSVATEADYVAQRAAAIDLATMLVGVASEGYERDASSRHSLVQWVLLHLTPEEASSMCVNGVKDEKWDDLVSVVRSVTNGIRAPLDSPNGIRAPFDSPNQILSR